MEKPQYSHTIKDISLLHISTVHSILVFTQYVINGKKNCNNEQQEITFYKKSCIFKTNSRILQLLIILHI